MPRGYPAKKSVSARSRSPAPRGVVSPSPRLRSPAPRRLASPRRVEKRHFDFQLYSDEASFERRKLVLKGFAEDAIMFETRSRDHPRGQKYLSESINIRQLVDNWNNMFPSDEAQPNSFINAFTRDGRRKVLTLALSNPTLKGDKLYFDYDLDRFENELDLEDDFITQWTDKRERVYNVSLLIDYEVGGVSTTGPDPLIAGAEAGAEAGAAAEVGAEAGDVDLTLDESVTVEAVVKNIEDKREKLSKEEKEVIAKTVKNLNPAEQQQLLKGTQEPVYKIEEQVAEDAVDVNANTTPQQLQDSANKTLNSLGKTFVLFYKYFTQEGRKLLAVIKTAGKAAFNFVWRALSGTTLSAEVSGSGLKAFLVLPESVEHKVATQTMEEFLSSEPRMSLSSFLSESAPPNSLSAKIPTTRLSGAGVGDTPRSSIGRTMKTQPSSAKKPKSASKRLK